MQDDIQRGDGKFFSTVLIEYIHTAIDFIAIRNSTLVVNFEFRGNGVEETQAIGDSYNNIMFMMISTNVSCLSPFPPHCSYS